MENVVQNKVRLSLPSKGRLAEEALSFLDACGIKINKTNPRQYEATIPNLPDLVVLFQRPGDIVVSVRDGSVDFGITGLDMVEEKRGENGDLLILHDTLGFGQCALTLAVPENWSDTRDVSSLIERARKSSAPLRIATKFPNLTQKFLSPYKIDTRLISAEGTLETAPSIGYADMISDLVSSGQTLRDNRLRSLKDGVILKSQAVLIGNTLALKPTPKRSKSRAICSNTLKPTSAEQKIWRYLSTCAAIHPAPSRTCCSAKKPSAACKVLPFHR